MSESLKICVNNKFKELYGNSKVIKKVMIKKIFDQLNLGEDELKSSDLFESYYMIQNNIKEKPLCKCENCNNKVNFLSLSKGYRTYCCRKCINKDPVIRKKIEDIFIEKYGVKYATIIPGMEQKRKKTYNDKYGVEYITQWDGMKEKRKKTYNDKYGVDHITQWDGMKTKRETTYLDKYGVKHITQWDGMKEKSKKTLLDRYGVDHNTKIKSVIIQQQKTRRKNYFNYFLESDRMKSRFIPLFSVDDFIGFNKKIYKWKCCNCDHEFEFNFYNGWIPNCNNCMKGNRSNPELEILNFIKENYKGKVESGDRTILDGKEIDIYLPELNIGIEFHGLHWHSEISGGTLYKYHQDKEILSTQKGTKLIQIFEDEWVNKRDIVESIIKNNLKLSKRIFARKVNHCKVSNNDAKLFYLNNHLQGYIHGLHYGLVENGKLISLITFGGPRFSNKHDFEILRFCNLKGHNVIGGLSKIIKLFIKEVNPNSIITYADARYGNGKGYEKSGFNFVKLSKPGFYYVKNNRRENRMKYQKHKLVDILEKFDPNISAWQNMLLNGYDRIWDAGNYIYEWNK